MHVGVLIPVYILSMHHLCSSNDGHLTSDLVHTVGGHLSRLTCPVDTHLLTVSATIDFLSQRLLLLTHADKLAVDIISSPKHEIFDVDFEMTLQGCVWTGAHDNHSTSSLLRGGKPRHEGQRWRDHS